MKKLFPILLIVVLMGGLILGGCAEPTPAPSPEPAPATTPAPTPVPQQGPIKIGVMYPLSGPLAVVGPRMVDGVEFGFEEAGYEVAGRKIELIIEDSGTAP